MDAISRIFASRSSYHAKTSRHVSSSCLGSLLKVRFRIFVNSIIAFSSSPAWETNLVSSIISEISNANKALGSARSLKRTRDNPLMLRTKWHGRVVGHTVDKSSAGVAFSNTWAVYIPQARNSTPLLFELVLKRSESKKEKQ